MTSKQFEIDGLDLQAVKRTVLRGIGGLVIALAPLILDPNINYVIHFNGHAINLTSFVVVIGAGIVRAIEAFVTNNTSVTPITPTAPIIPNE